VIRKGGSVELDDLGTFKANWSPSGRSVSFTPSLGFKVGTALGKPLTDAQAKGIPLSELMRLTYTYDGDTLGARRTVNGQPQQVKLRLAYIDAPEMAQSPWGIRARSYLRTLLYVNEPILVDIKAATNTAASSPRSCAAGLWQPGARLALEGYVALWMCPSTQQAYQAAQASPKPQEGRDLVAPGSPSNPLVIPMSPPYDDLAEFQEPARETVAYRIGSEVHRHTTRLELLEERPAPSSSMKR
jgi:endonuclease YncB( thermonuclease family)